MMPIVNCGIECAAGIPDGGSGGLQAKSLEGRKLPVGMPQLPDRFLAFTDAEFWAMVWEGRARYPSEPHGKLQDESATTARLDEVEGAFSAEQWDSGFELLQPIGAPGRDAVESGAPLYAWEPENCARVSAGMDSAEGAKAIRTAGRDLRHHQAKGIQARQLCGGSIRTRVGGGEGQGGNRERAVWR